MIDSTKGFTLVRTFEASPKEVWEAWIDPDEAAQWWHPRGATTPRESVEIDARVGGRYTYTMVDDTTGQRVVTGGVYREVEPYERLAFTWGEPDGDPDDSPLITISLEQLDEGTRMTFDLRGIDGTRGDGSFYDGWESALDSLGDHVNPTPARH
ncbi:MAG: SRPBCC domain-containing protein [Propionibacteriaceae bacterium]